MVAIYCPWHETNEDLSWEAALSIIIGPAVVETSCGHANRRQAKPIRVRIEKGAITEVTKGIA